MCDHRKTAGGHGLWHEGRRIGSCGVSGKMGGVSVEWMGSKWGRGCGGDGEERLGIGEVMVKVYSCVCSN